MNIYDATRQIIKTACPNVADADIFHRFMNYTPERAAEINEKPLIEFDYSNKAEISSHSGRSGIIKAELSINVLGSLEKINLLADAISLTLSGQRIIQSNFEFTLVEKMVSDQLEASINTRRISMSFAGIIIVSPESENGGSV